MDVCFRNNFYDHSLVYFSVILCAGVFMKWGYVPKFFIGHITLFSYKLTKPKQSICFHFDNFYYDLNIIGIKLFSTKM
jgi:hypothetical protein